jgi:hypothetical protein
VDKIIAMDGNMRLVHLGSRSKGPDREPLYKDRYFCDDELVAESVQKYKSKSTKKQVLLMEFHIFLLPVVVSLNQRCAAISKLQRMFIAQTRLQTLLFLACLHRFADMTFP